MSEEKGTSLLYRLVNSAREIARTKEHKVTSHYHLLLAMCADKDAKVFCDRLNFPLAKITANVKARESKVDESYKKVNETITTNSHFIGIFLIDVCLEAQRLALLNNRAQAGYLEILKAIMREDNSVIAKLIAQAVPLNDVNAFLERKESEWPQNQPPELTPAFIKAARAKERAKILNLGPELKGKIFEQDRAIEGLERSMKIAAAGLKERDKPIGSYLFVGPTGVGKTEVAKQLAAHLDIPLVRFDMSEFMENHTVSSLIGAPPGYVGYGSGGQLTNAINSSPRCVLLLDEIEKAHPDIYNTLLQIMDNGALTDRAGKNVDFRNVTLIMTSNVGAKSPSIVMGFGQAAQNSESPDYDQAVKAHFKPEFINRLDGIIPFNPISIEAVRKIAANLIKDFNNLPGMIDNNLDLALTPEAMEYLVQRGHSKEYGARPLKRLINEKIKLPLADLILAGTEDGFLKVQLDPGSGNIALKYRPLDLPEGNPYTPLLLAKPKPDHAPTPNP